VAVLLIVAQAGNFLRVLRDARKDRADAVHVRVGPIVRDVPVPIPNGAVVVAGLARRQHSDLAGLGRICAAAATDRQPPQENALVSQNAQQTARDAGARGSVSGGEGGTHRRSP
jgi:hypothetical protein